jgi:hypothetical protein
MEHSQEQYSEEARKALIQSMCGPLMSKIKLILANPKKNIVLAKNTSLVTLVETISE